MTLRRPAAHLRRAPGWRRSGDEAHWESLISEGEPSVTHPPRVPRPQSAIEGGELDIWLRHLQAIQSKLRVPAEDQVPAFNDRTASMPVLNKEPAGRAWRHTGSFPFSRGSSSCGSSSLCESSLGSQESLQTGYFLPPERRGSWERAHIMQAPKKEQTQLSYISPVKIGWLPIQRRATVVDNASKKNQAQDHSAGHVKLKQPITPTFQKNLATPKEHDGEVERSHTSLSALGVRTWQTPDQGSPIIKQVPEGCSFTASEGDRPVSWHALRKAWNTKRVSAFPGGSKSNELSTGANSDPSLMKTTSTEPLEHSPLHHPTSADVCRPHTLLQGTNTTEPYRSHTPLRRTSSVQPIKATSPLCGTRPSHIQTSSAVTTLIPQNKAGFSSITISSKKVSRSASLPSSYSNSNSPWSSESSSPPPSYQHMEPNSSQVTLQRRATIVKVTEKEVMSSPVPSTTGRGTPPADHDTVVRRRKATIIKVTEHRESYTPAKVRHPEYRHSYTGGVYTDSSTWSQGELSLINAAPSNHHENSVPHSAVAPNAFTPDPEKNGTVHRSTLSLFVNNPHTTSSEASPKAAGQRSDRPRRPLSCYGNVIGHVEPSKESVIQLAARKWSCGLPQETNINPVNSDSGFIRAGKAVKEAGHQVADTIKANRGEGERMLQKEDSTRMVSPLTLIKDTDPHCHQSPEEVLAINAAAIIANIKLQSQLSKKKTPSGDSEKDSTASPQGNTVTNEGKHVKERSDHRQRHHQPHAAVNPLSVKTERSGGPVSLQQALQRSRPGFISRSQGRVRELERRAQERRELSDSVDPQLDAVLRQRNAHSAHSTSLNGNLFKPRDRAITGKDMQPRTKRTPAEVKRKKEEEKKRDVCLNNRQRAELFKKKLLAQVLQKSNN
ncbi:(E2-independent) E3 ubiquitin-conjugating enzyme FATS [Parambassis ranga]|uniref:(E2-independent) E3 ubiquitin-conjugating enzyme FATS n=1 Tax=Parambassis ranga TaxID=210632 RepID=A0A6P7KB89_9TELE|nr:(E2-independent) E3 ubiquitin-conjugating enzyme FATS [Parambassis ranga]XP_028286823.1 (E2-independent) E3 ubiquitin-conjugating enzyme FATS [Parambassis ranga]XP_028286824.1 (E2-independent) E3 ubiquitin-conjugating enzyme FATS [Parambassis ranga]XP_028286825.1 (E2-independent) E3 ubiquitin-conjugating enzyme FATS [Parambassis ranga]